MDIVLDYTFRIAPAALRAAGALGAIRYLKPNNAPAYRITAAEYRELVGAGIAVTLNWEYDARDWLGGAARGTSHGQQAVAQARALGYPAGSVIIGSADWDVKRAEWESAARGYARGYATAVRAGGYRPGAYGPWDLLTWVRDEQIMDAFWQAGMSTAWSGGRNAHAWPGAHLRQRGHREVGGQDTDWNEILIPNWGDDMLELTTPVHIASYTNDPRFPAENNNLAGVWQGGYYYARLAKANTDALLAAAAADEARDNATLAAVKALAIASGLDPAPILDAIAAARAETHDLVVQLQQQLAQAQTRNVQLAKTLAAAGGALEAADDDLPAG